MGINFKAVAHSGHQSLGGHLIKKDENETIKLKSRGLESKTSVAATAELHQLSADASHRGTNRTLLHVAASPDKQLTEKQWEQLWGEYEKEFKLEGQPFLEATHTKHRANGELQEHKHRVYASVDMNRGTVVNLDQHMQRQEYLARKLETEFGHDLVKGAHNFTAHKIAIDRKDEKTAKAIEDAGLLHGDRARAQTTQIEQQQQKRTGISKSDVLDQLAKSYNKAQTEKSFVAELGLNGLHVMKGDKTTVLVDREGGAHPLNRYLNQLKKAGHIQSVDKFDLVNNWKLEHLEPKKSLERKTQRIRKNKQTEKALDNFTTQAERVPGIRQKTEWQQWRESVLTEAYGEALAKELERENVLVQKRTHNKTITITSKDKEARIFDTGERVNADKGTDKEIQLMLKVAHAKGWQELDLTGSDEFKARAGEQALKQGFTLSDKELEAALLAKIEADKQAEIQQQEANKSTLNKHSGEELTQSAEPDKQTELPDESTKKQPTITDVTRLQHKATIAHKTTGLESVFTDYRDAQTALNTTIKTIDETRDLALKDLDKHALTEAERLIKDERAKAPDYIPQHDLKQAREADRERFKSDRDFQAYSSTFPTTYQQACDQSWLGQLGSEPKALKAEFAEIADRNQTIRQQAASTFEALVDTIKEHSVEQVESLDDLYKQRDDAETLVQDRERDLLDKADEIDFDEVEQEIDQVLEQQNERNFDLEVGFGLSLF